MKITFSIAHNQEDATLITGEARNIALIELAKLAFVLKIEKSSGLRLRH